MIDRIRSSEIAELTEKYIARRVPCIITEIPEDLGSLNQCLDLSSLESLAGQAFVAVEPVSAKGTFGTAETKQRMSFSTFLNKLQANEKVYLTTQYSEEEDAAVLTEPLSTLHNSLDFPIFPAIAGQLVPAKINLWLGASADGTTSGLHHDFHDNFYILLSGEKRFRIFKPSFKACKALKVHGKPHEIFPNGLISYNGNLCSDGLTRSVKAQIRVDMCEKRLSEARNNNQGIEAAEEEYEDAMDALLRSKLIDEDEEEDGDFDVVTEFEDEAGGYEDSVEEQSAEEEEAPEFKGASRLPEFEVGKTSVKSAQQKSSRRSSATTDDEIGDTEPPSFSSLTSEEVSKLIQADVLEGSEFVLHKGEVLYLPASHFHEVISLSGSQTFHMAVNYWFFPPDDSGGTYLDEEIMQEIRQRLHDKYPRPEKSGEQASKRRKLQGS